MNKYGAKTVYFSHNLNRQLLPDEVTVYTNRFIQPPEIAKFGKVLKLDSKLEFQVFQILNSSYLVSDIIPHYPIDILLPNQSRCYPNGKKWKVDFLAKGHHKEVLMVVEAKGVVTRDFPWTLINLEREKPELFQKLWLVFNRIPSNNLIKNLRKTVDNYPKIVTLSQFKSLIT